MNYNIEKLRLRNWLKAEEAKEKITNASRDELANAIYLYLHIALDINKEELETLPWYDVIDLLYETIEVNKPFDFPILIQSNSKVDELPWKYDGDMWYGWLHLLSKSYNWSIEYIENLEVDTALALLQEIIIQDQLEKEFQWGMSEVAYVYNEATKKSEYKPLKRPLWMEKQAVVKEVPKAKIRREFIPMGNVVRWNSEK